MLGSSPSVRAEKAEAMGVVNQYTERIFLLESDYLIQFTEGSGHTVNTLSDQQDTTAVLISLSASAGKNLLAVNHIVVAVFVLAADMEADSVQQAGMALGVIDYDIMATRQSVDSRDDTLITEVVEESVLLLLEVGEYLLELLMVAGVSRHHPGSHRICKTPIGSSLRVSLADLRMVGQAKIVVKGPVKHRDTVEGHVGPQLTLETGIHVITETLLEILANRATGISLDPVENITIHSGNY